MDRTLDARLETLPLQPLRSSILRPDVAPQSPHQPPYRRSIPRAQPLPPRHAPPHFHRPSLANGLIQTLQNLNLTPNLGGVKSLHRRSTPPSNSPLNPFRIPFGHRLAELSSASAAHRNPFLSLSPNRTKTRRSFLLSGHYTCSSANVPVLRMAAAPAPAKPFRFGAPPVEHLPSVPVLRFRSHDPLAQERP